MFSCFRQNYNLPKKFLIFNSAISRKSAFSSVSNSLRCNTNKLACKKLNYLKRIQLRCFSLQSIHSFYNSIGSSEASRLFRDILIDTQEFTGLSWSVIIITSSIIMKLIVSLPCGIYQQYLMSKLELIKVELGTLAKNLKEKVLAEAYKEKWTKSKLHSVFYKKIREQQKILVIKNNCHPFKITILFFAQLPVWLLLTLTIRNIAKDVSTGQYGNLADALLFENGGPFWSRNLAVPDSTFILPTVNFLSTLACTELSFLNETPKKIVQNSVALYVHKIYPYFTRLLAVALFFISAAVPSAVSLFWTSNSLLALAQKLLIMSPRARRFFKIPKTPSEINKPYSQAWNTFLEKLTKLFLKK